MNEQRLLTGLQERIRDVRQAPDGTLWLLTDSRDGKVLRLAAADVFHANHLSRQSG